MIGKQLLHYRIERSLGQGGMGVVYLALDTKLDRKVAVKVLSEKLVANEEALERFRREARAVAALNHPGIVTLYSIESVDETRFLTMEFVEGETLSGFMKREPARPDLARKLGIELSDALQHAHQAGIAHRDIKPANVLLSRSGSAKLLDFGLATMTAKDSPSGNADSPTEMALTTAGTLMGTMRYMSPEQARGQPASASSDLFSLGIILYELGTGIHPFPGDQPATQLAAILRDDPLPASEAFEGVDAALSLVIARCLEKEPARRFQSAGEIVEALTGDQPAANPPAPVRAAPSQPRNSIAVLPFSDLSRERDQDYFCDGLAEELINGLGKLRALRVASRTSAFRFRDRDQDVREIGKLLGVASVLGGSVRKAGERLRVSVQLDSAEDGYHLWSETFDRTLDDVFVIQDDIAHRVVEALEVELAAEPDETIIQKREIDIEAYNLYLKALHQANRRTPDSLEKSIELFHAAIALDPDHSLLHSGLADSYALLGIYGAAPAKEVMPKARRAAERALELEPDRSQAHVSLGCVRSVHEWDWVAGAKDFERALELDPDSVWALHWHATQNLLPLGRFAEAGASLRRAKVLDPLSVVISLSLGLALYFERSFEEAVAEFGNTLELEPLFPVGHLFLARALLELDRHDKALAAARRALELSPESAEMIANLGHVHAARGEIDEARAVLARLDKLADHQYVSPALIAQVHSALGDASAAVRLLEQAARDRTADLAWVAVRPVFDSLHGEPGFVALLETMNLDAPGES